MDFPQNSREAATLALYLFDEVAHEGAPIYCSCRLIYLSSFPLVDAHLWPYRESGSSLMGRIYLLEHKGNIIVSVTVIEGKDVFIVYLTDFLTTGTAHYTISRDEWPTVLEIVNDSMDIEKLEWREVDTSINLEVLG